MSPTLSAQVIARARAIGTVSSTLPPSTLIANGDHDRMVPSVLSEDLHHRIPGSELIIYPHSGHGAILQFHQEFAPVAAEFLAD